jgi:hypothetical protein
MPKRTTILRRTVWYQWYKNLAERLDGKGLADTLRAVHQLLNINFQYGSMTTAAAAHDSVEQVIKDLNLDGAVLSREDIGLLHQCVEYSLANIDHVEEITDEDVANDLQVIKAKLEKM